MFYHASPVKDLKVLEPRISDHGVPLIYFSKKRENVLVYLSNAVEKYCRENGFFYDGPWKKWGPYGFDPDGILRIEEYYPGMLEETYQGVSGYIYEVAEVPQNDYPLNIPDAVADSQAVRVDAAEYVPDAWEAILAAEKQGLIRILRYKDFSDQEIDTIEILLQKLYRRYGIDDGTDLSAKQADEYPTMSDFYELCQKEYDIYDSEVRHIYTLETLQNICLGINSMCVGAESKYFNGHTNIQDSNFLVFGVKGLLETNKRLKDTMLFNILSFMSNQLLGEGHTAASIDELYLFLTNMTAIEYIRNAMKRVRKKESSIILASQNIEDFLIPSIREFTKPLFSIPTHQFLFNAGQINPKEYMDALMVEPSEFELIKYPERGTCLYRCGNERYLLQVIAPDYKAAMFGKAGGR